MPLIPIKDILISARQESHRMRHYYLGVEHLLIALLEIRSGLASTILSEYGFKSEYVIDAVRRKAGKGSRHRLWTGILNTPRADVLITLAQEIAMEDSRKNINERDLLRAILDEEDSMPVRVLVALGLDLVTLKNDAKTKASTRTAEQSFVGIDVSHEIERELTSGQLFILRRMFYGYSKVRVEARLSGGYTSSDLLVVKAIHMDGREDAAVVVKIGETALILDEAQRYERYVKGTLPPLTARLEDRPIAPETSDLAALKYTFITDAEGNPKDMAAVVRDWEGKKLAQWLRQHLYHDFGENWWKQSRPYRFEAWQEYDSLLPPVLTLQITRDDEPPKGTHIIRIPVRRSKLNALEYGDTVMIENFTVYKVDRENNRMRLAVTENSDTSHAYQIEVKGIDFEHDTYFRGEVVERIIGQVWQTRDEQLVLALRKLDPDFDIDTERMSFGDKKLPNPIFAYQRLLDMTVDGTMSTIHGDLHVGNVLIGPNDVPLLIDFGRTRDGHTIFDWANLEISLISEAIVPLGDGDWDAARELLQYIMAVRDDIDFDLLPEPIRERLEIIRELRSIVSERLAYRDKWEEYFISLAMSSLRAVTWKTMPSASRRMMYLVSAMAIDEVERLTGIGRAGGNRSPDATDIATDG